MFNLNFNLGNSGNILLLVFATVILTQIIKTIISFIETTNFDLKILYRTGGMPSSHSAGVCALSTSIFIFEGISTAFVISVVMAGIVIADALGVRRETGEQANVINKLMKKEHIKGKNFSEFVGHTPYQVAIGILIGILIPFGIKLYFGI